MNSINRITKEDIDNFCNKPNILNYQHISTKSAIYPGQGSCMGLMYAALKVNGEAGELAEHIGKALRDDKFGETGSLTKERRELIIKEIGDILWYLSAICNEINYTLVEAALVNLKKLKDRTDRNQLQGSGDER